MFGFSNKKIDYLEQQVVELQRTNQALQAENKKLLIENKAQNRELTQLKAIKGAKNTMDKEVVGNFQPALSSAEAVKRLEKLVDIKFPLLDGSDLEPLNIVLHKITQLKSGEYQPSKDAISSCDEFFNFDKRLTIRKLRAMIYKLLDIQVTSWRFDIDIGYDGSIKLIEKIFSYIN